MPIEKDTMAKGSFTPGPWEWEPEPTDDDKWGDSGPNLRSVPLGKIWDAYWENKNAALHGAPPSGRILSGWGFDAWGINVEEADARLIAAAWELFEAAVLLETAEEAHANCEECEGQGVPELCEKCFPMFDDARVKRRTALAKANPSP